MLRFGTDGVRGVALRDITTHAVQLYARAAARELHCSLFVVGYDTRESSVQLARAVEAGFVAEGVEVLWAGMCPTPTVAFFAEHCQAGAAVITASHNPYTDNGLKFFGEGGMKLTDEEELRIQNTYESLVQSETVEVANGGAGEVALDLDAYCAHICASITEVATEIKLVIDCANGAMSEVAPRVFKKLGISPSFIHCSPDGKNVNEACGAAHPDSLMKEVIRSKADLGIAFDGDGDRIIAVDGNGEVINGDQLIALFALQLKARNALVNNTVAVTVMTNMGFHIAMQDAGINVITTPVGDRSILIALQEAKACLGGEQSGHIIFTQHATTGDGLLAAVQLLSVLHSRQQSLQEASQEVMKSLPQVLINVPIQSGVTPQDLLVQHRAAISEVEQLLVGKGRLLVRTSGTEPLVRVMVEAQTSAEAQKYAERIAHILSHSASGQDR
ncbi:MAG: phosphoglucosamine mutase [Ilumatobacteraceae bacterium]|nr:phosphoglucosamine mutase [Ilumatobacteraceae bacterium]